MKYIELSIKDLEKRSKELAEKVSEDFLPDVVVFIAKGSFLIGDEISQFFNVPLVECFAVREGNMLKVLAGPVIKVLPKFLKQYLREKEMKSGMHVKYSNRNIYLDKGAGVLKSLNNILIVDDSVDSGNTASQVYSYFRSNYKEKELKFAALNYFDDSRSTFNVDYHLFNNTMMSGPWSKDSKEYREFLKRYEFWKTS